MSRNAERINLPFQFRQAWPLAKTLLDEVRMNLSEGKPLGTTGENSWGPELPVNITPKAGSVHFHFEMGVTVEVKMLETSQFELMAENEEWAICGATVRWHQQDHRLPKHELQLDVEALKWLREERPFGGAYLASSADLTGYVLVEKFSSRRPWIHVDPLIEVRNVAKSFTFDRLNRDDRQRAIDEAVAYCKSHGYQNYWGFDVVQYPQKGRMLPHEYLLVQPKVVATYPSIEETS